MENKNWKQQEEIGTYNRNCIIWKNIPFINDSRYVKKKGNNSGNIETILEFRIDGGNKVLENHFNA